MRYVFYISSILLMCLIVTFHLGGELERFSLAEPVVTPTIRQLPPETLVVNDSATTDPIQVPIGLSH
mgnify:FL=1